MLEKKDKKQQESCNILKVEYLDLSRSRISVLKNYLIFFCRRKRNSKITSPWSVGLRQIS